MAKQIQLRRGTTSQHSAFTGAAGEVTVDTDKKVVVVHDGSTAGGIPMAKDSVKVDKVTSTDNAVVRFDGTTGQVQNSGVVITDSGNVGVGTSSPSGKLVVNGGEVLWGATSNLGFLGYTGGYPLVGSVGAVPLALYTNSTEKMRIDSSGNVGIGTSPSEKLHVKGKLLIERADNTADKAYITTNLGILDIHSQDGGTSTGAIRFVRGTTSTESMRIDSAGNVGIGVTPSVNAGLRTLNVSNSNGNYAAVTAGASGGDYGYVGYNFGTTSLAGSYKYQVNDTASALGFSAGGFKFQTAGTGTAGNTITWNSAMTLGLNGNLSVGDSVTTGSKSFIMSPTELSIQGLDANVAFRAIKLNPSGGNLLVGTTTDNGVDKLQVNGSIKAGNAIVKGNYITDIWNGYSFATYIGNRFFGTINVSAVYSPSANRRSSASYVVNFFDGDQTTINLIGSVITLGGGIPFSVGFSAGNFNVVNTSGLNNVSIYVTFNGSSHG